jgi:hypothetical protein
MDMEEDMTALILRFLGAEAGAVKVDYAMAIGATGFLFVKLISSAVGGPIADGGAI